MYFIFKISQTKTDMTINLYYLDCSVKIKITVSF